MIHHPGCAKVDPKDEENQELRHGTWRALEEAVDAGLIRSIGVSNFKPNHIELLLKEASIMPAINQFEVHPIYVEHETIEFCKQNDILIQAYSPFA